MKKQNKKLGIALLDNRIEYTKVGFNYVTNAGDYTTTTAFAALALILAALAYFEPPLENLINWLLLGIGLLVIFIIAKSILIIQEHRLIKKLTGLYHEKDELLRKKK